jgi:exodeoxyribonuclease VII small subunit
MTTAAPRHETSAPSFEEALSQLQQHVLDLESGTLSLEETISTFRNATELATTCQRMIAEAELRITQLAEASDDGFPASEVESFTTGH